MQQQVTADGASPGCARPATFSSFFLCIIIIFVTADAADSTRAGPIQQFLFFSRLGSISQML